MLALFIGLALGFSSCDSSFFDETVYSDLKDDTYSKADAQLLCNGIYSLVRFWSYGTENNFVHNTEGGTDCFFYNKGADNTISDGGTINYLNQSLSSSELSTLYDSFFDVITQSNELIRKYSNWKDDHEDNDKAIALCVAQARFWRCMAYDKMCQVWGSVPLVMEDTENIDIGKAQATDAELRTYFLEEYTALTTLLPKSYEGDVISRPTRWAAYAALARYELNSGDNLAAAKAAKCVIDSGGFALADHYTDLFASPNNAEDILVIENKSYENQGNRYQAYSLETRLLTLLNLTGISAHNEYGMPYCFYQTFDKNDLRAQRYNDTTRSGLILEGYYALNDSTPLYGTAQEPSSLQATNHRVITLKWPLTSSLPSGVEGSGCFPLLRLGETYLTYAEAEARLGHEAEARLYVNKIRTRAGLEDLEELSGDSLLTAILAERGWETYHEGYRREDLKRYGVLLKKVSEKYASTHEGNPLPWADETYRALWPFPEKQFMYNVFLKQNPGY